jgi:hypothetical protein
MPNGHHGTDEEWKRLEAPLREVDGAIDVFGTRHGIVIGRNYHNWPERSLRWGSDLERVIQIYLQDAQRLTWDLWVCVSQDRGRQRFWKRQFLRQDVSMSDISPVINSLLEEAFRIVSAWRAEDLEFVTNLDR